GERSGQRAPLLGVAKEPRLADPYQLAELLELGGMRPQKTYHVALARRRSLHERRHGPVETRGKPAGRAPLRPDTVTLFQKLQEALAELTRLRHVVISPAMASASSSGL